LIHQDDGSETRYLLADGLGSVRTELVSDTVEAVTTYSPFGSLLAQTGAGGTVYGFTGEQYDSAASLFYLRARYYNSDLRVFMSADPVFPGSRNPQGFNWYSYASNNPINKVDPAGLCAEYGDDWCWNIYDLIMHYCPECRDWKDGSGLWLEDLGIQRLQEILSQLRAGKRVDEILFYEGNRSTFVGPPQPRGYRAVVANLQHIIRAAQAHDIPPVILAAAIMNQGSAVTRLFGTELIERCQLGIPFDSPYTGERATAGIAQLTPGEIRKYVPGCDTECLFQPAKAIEGMAVKIALADELLPSDINRTDRWMVLALAQNNGLGAAQTYLAKGGAWKEVYGEIPSDWDQIGKILKNVRYMSEIGLYNVPWYVDLERWQSLADTSGQFYR
jgi:RHS repeat-associated protein